MDDAQLFDFDSPLNESSYIKVIGVGGGGNNAVNHMFRKGIAGVDFYVCNTDKKALVSSPVPNKLVLGTQGLGAGGRPEKARKAAEAKADEIKELLSHDTKMLFITAGMGGGTGTGAAPVIARLAKEVELISEDEELPDKILVVAIVTTPFKFEGRHRLEQAFEGVEALREHVDSILVINNEKLRGFGNLPMSQVFGMADDVLLTAVKGIAEIITLNAYVNIDFRDVKTVMEGSGTALMGIGEGQGENRGLQAVEEATRSVLLNDDDITGAKDVLLYIACGPENEISMDEVGEVTDYVSQHTGGIDTNVIWGIGTDENLGDKVKITLIATGFEQKEKTLPQVHTLQPDTPKDPEPSPAPKTDDPVLIHRPATEAEKPAPVSSAPSTSAAPAAPAEPVREPKVYVLEDEVSQPVPTVTSKPVVDDGFVLHTAAAPKSETQAANPYVAPRVTVARQTPEYTTVAPTSAPVAPAQPTSAPVTPVQVAPAPVAPATKPQPVGGMAGMTEDRASRIRRIHDLLHNHEDGPQQVERMGLDFDDIYQTKPSSESESSRVLDSNGVMREKPSLYNLPD